MVKTQKRTTTGDIIYIWDKDQEVVDKLIQISSKQLQNKMESLKSK